MNHEGCGEWLMTDHQAVTPDHQAVKQYETHVHVTGPALDQMSLI